MKLLYILLAFALSTGTQAFVLSDEPDSKLAQLKEYFMNLRRTANEKVDALLEVEFFSQLTQNITANYLEVRERLYNLEQTLSMETKHVYDLVLKTLWGMWNRALETLNEQRKKLSSTTEAMSTTLPSLWESYLDPVLQRMAPYTEDLRSTLSTTVAQLEAKMNKMLAQRLEDLGSQLNPYVQEVQNKWRELQMPSEPVKERLRQGLETINNSLVKVIVIPVLEIFVVFPEN